MQHVTGHLAMAEHWRDHRCHESMCRGIPTGKICMSWNDGNERSHSRWKHPLESFFEPAA